MESWRVELDDSCGLVLSFLFCLFVSLGPYPWHMDVPRQGVESKLQLQAYTTATATLDPGCIFDLRHRLQHGQILNSLREARDQTQILMNTMSGS